MTSIPYQQYPPEWWQQYLMNAHKALMQNPHDPTALQGIRDATEALNAHEKTSIGMQPSQSFESVTQGGGPQTGVPLIPTLGPLSPDVGDIAPGGDLNAVAQGMISAAKGLPKGLAQTLKQVGSGDIPGAVKGVAKGLASTAQSSMAPWELAMRELSGEAIPQSERTQKLRQGGAAVTGLETMALPGQIARGAGVAAKPTAPEPPEPTPAGATPAQPLTPIEGTGGRGFTAEGPPTPPVTPAMEGMSKIRGFMGNEAGSVSPELMLLLGALGGRLGAGSAALNALKNLNYGAAARGALGTIGSGAGMTPTDSTGIK